MEVWFVLWCISGVFLILSWRQLYVMNHSEYERYLKANYWYTWLDGAFFSMLFASLIVSAMT